MTMLALTSTKFLVASTVGEKETRGGARKYS